MAENGELPSTVPGEKKRLVELAELAAERRSSFDPSPSTQLNRSQVPVAAASGSLSMLRPRALQNVLKEVVTSGVRGSMVLNEDGSLLSHCGTSESSSRIVAAISSNIFTAYQRSGQTIVEGMDANVFIIINEEGGIVVKRVATKLICVYAASAVPIGMLRAKVEALSERLREPLNTLA